MSAAGLRRTLTLRDLVLYGVIVIQPVAPMPVFGVLVERGRGHVVTAILVAMAAVLCTSISYGRMARAHPSMGSAFTYVAREIHPRAGFAVGWVMLMDYVLNPLICTVWCAHQAHQLAPGVPGWGWKIVFASGFTLLNLRGIQTSARINAGMAAVMGVVITLILVLGARAILGAPHDAAYFTQPFYDPETFSLRGLLGCTSVAVLTYVGFDGISTLSEEAKDPRRDIPRATVLTCVVIGILSAIEVYVAQLVWPYGAAFPNVETAYVHVAARLWPPLFPIVGLTLLLATVGSGMGAQLGAARLLLGMGRSNALPRSFFGAVDPRHHIPRNNVLLVGAVALGGAFLLSYGLGVEMLNFGALLAFMGVNAAALMRYWVRARERRIHDLLLPLAGILICFSLWVNLSRLALVAGSIWLALGLAFGMVRTRAFREPVPR